MGYMLLLFLVPMQVVNTPKVFTTVVLKNPLKSIYTSADGFCMLKIHIFTALCTAFVLQHIVPIIFLQKQQHDQTVNHLKNRLYKLQLFEMHIMAMHTCQIILYGSPSPYDMDIHRIFDFDPIKVIVLGQIHLPLMDRPSVNASMAQIFCSTRHLVEDFVLDVYSYLLGVFQME